MLIFYCLSTTNIQAIPTSFPPISFSFPQFLAWIEALSPRQSPVWLGLPDAAENVILTTQGTKTRMKMLRMQQIDDDDDDEGGSGGGGGGGSGDGVVGPLRLDSESGGRDKDGGVPAWMKNLGSMVAGWLAKLPKRCGTFYRAAQISAMKGCCKCSVILPRWGRKSEHLQSSNVCWESDC